MLYNAVAGLFLIISAPRREPGKDGSIFSDYTQAGWQRRNGDL